jgi:hypothetical protein
MLRQGYKVVEEAAKHVTELTTPPPTYYYYYCYYHQLNTTAVNYRQLMPTAFNPPPACSAEISKKVREGLCGF